MMKRAMVLAAFVAGAALTAAGQEKAAQMPASRPAASVAEHEKLMEEACVLLTDLRAALEVVKDVETAKAARGAMEGISQRSRELGRKARALGSPDATSGPVLEAKYRARVEAAEGRVQKELTRITALDGKVMGELAPVLPGLALGRPEREVSTRPASRPATRVGPPDRYEVLTEQACATMAEMVTALGGIQDLATAKAARPAFEKVGRQMRALTKEMKALGEPDKEREVQLQEKYEGRVAVLGRQTQTEMARISKLSPEVVEEVAKLIQKVMEEPAKP